MLNWMSLNFINILLICMLGLLVGLILRSMMRRKKAGGGCGCAGCSGCGGCGGCGKGTCCGRTEASQESGDQAAWPRAEGSKR